MSYYVKTIGEKATISLLVTKSGQGVPGLSPTIEIRRRSDNFYLDFAAVAPPYWVASGGAPQKVLTANPNLVGEYKWIFDHSVYGDGGIEEYTIIYRNDLPYRLLQLEMFSFELSSSAVLDVEFIKKMLRNKQTLEALAPDHFIHTVFDNDESTEIHKADISMNGIGTVETRQPL